MRCEEEGRLTTTARPPFTDIQEETRKASKKQNHDRDLNRIAINQNSEHYSRHNQHSAKGNQHVSPTRQVESFI